MFKRLEEKWKKEWIQKNEEKLIAEYKSRFLSESYRSQLWMEGFAAGVSKSWDSLIPIIQGNVEQLKKKVYEDAINDSIKRFNGAKK